MKANKDSGRKAVEKGTISAHEQPSQKLSRVSVHLEGRGAIVLVPKTIRKNL